jgi:predicted acyltransferase
MLTVPVPDVQGVLAAGALEPGRDVGAYIDRVLLNGHLWAKSKTWDPEGVLSTVPALCSLLFGVLTGYTLRASIAPAHKAMCMLLAGGVLLMLGEVLDAALMPINKSLWTTSYCVFMTGWALLVFGAFYSLMDLQRWPALRAAAHALFKPLTIFGLNALFIFVLSSLIAKAFNAFKIASASGATASVKSALFAPIQSLQFSPQNTSLLFACAFLLLMFAIAWGLWTKRWFIKV